MGIVRWVLPALVGLVLAGAPMGPGAWAADTAATEQAATKRINLNTAAAEDLVRLKGIGEKKLEALRPFLTVE